MKIDYQIINFNLVFEKSITFSIFPPVIIRSILGKELRNLSCLFKNRNCSDCALKYTCAYSVVFESHIDKENDFISGRDRASHPFIIETDINTYQKTDKLLLSIILLGKGIEYLPYIYYALFKAGKQGLFKERVLFSITNVTNKGESLLLDKESINVKSKKESWEFKELPSPGNNIMRIKIDFLTPLRIKILGKYSANFEYSDLITSLERRAFILSGLYGDNSLERQDKTEDITEKKIIEKEFTWQDIDYYSARQKERLRLGGVTGHLILEGLFSQKELSLLDFGQIFHTGKNVSFGLGKIKKELLKDHEYNSNDPW